MSVLIDRLRAAGADMDGAMSRVLDDEELYETCFDIFMEDPSFSALGGHLRTRDWKAAFEDAHTLKGVAGNLGLTGIFTLTGQLVEPLRSGDPGGADLQAVYQALLEERDALKALRS